MDDKVIRVYVCPNCKNYYGSSGMGKLEEQPNIVRNSETGAREVIGDRTTCPSCGAKRVARYARLISVEEVMETRNELQKKVKREPMRARRAGDKSSFDQMLDRL